MKHLVTILFLCTGISAGLLAQTSVPCPKAEADLKLSQSCLGPLVVANHDVVVNLNGKTVSCNAANPWIGIDIKGVRGVQVQNGLVVNCVRGVSIVGGGRHTLKKLTLKQTQPFPQTDVRYGLYVEGSSGNWFESLISQGNSVGADITQTSFDNWMASVQLIGNLLDGLQLDYDATDNEVYNSLISNNRRFGVYFGATAARNVVNRNQILDNGWAGLIPHSVNIVEDNKVKRNGNTTDAAAWLKGGIIPFGSNNIIAGNEVTSNRDYGVATGLIDPYLGSANTIRWNIASLNTLWDLADLTQGLCTDNDWRENSGVKIYDRCENEGGLAPTYRVAGAGKAGSLAFEIHGRRINSGAASGRAKLINVTDAAGNPTTVRVEGHISCLQVDPNRPQVATIGMIVEKSSNPAAIPLYSTFHAFVMDMMPALGGVRADQVVASRANQFAPGSCPLPVVGAPPAGSPLPYQSFPSLFPAISKGEVMILVK